MTGNNIPSQNPADTSTLGGVLRSTFRKLLQSTDGMLPATVVAVNVKRTYATVKPAVMILGTDGTLTSRAQVARVPILTMGAGGFLMSFPIKKGDLGWILASDRDVSLFLQQSGEAGPNTDRLKSFEDGVFIPDIVRTWVLASEDVQNSTWQSADGTAKLTLGAAKVKVLHPTLVEFDTPSVTMSGKLAVAGGVGFFGTSPPGSRPTVTGALSTVSDTAAKAVLTSIIAVMSGNGEATNGTT